MTTKPGLKFSVAAIDSAKEILKALPLAPRETKEVSLREAIEELAPTIRGLLAKGYSRQQIVDLIQEQGVGCSLTSLKTYFRRSPGKTKAKSLAASTAGPAAAYQETGPAASRPVISAGSGGPEVGTNAGPRDATSAHPQSPPGRTVGGQAGVGLAATGATARAAAKAS
ncbi:MAG TPA: hypothetical protein VFG23_13795 [Polyangia bacterium]|nr:hypothetical protein [Polyangia bacterium]